MTSMTPFQVFDNNLAFTYLDITGRFYILKKSVSMKGNRERRHAPFLCNDGSERPHKGLRSLGRIKLHPRLDNIQWVES
jgi:hypothetical protein